MRSIKLSFAFIGLLAVAPYACANSSDTTEDDSGNPSSTSGSSSSSAGGMASGPATTTGPTTGAGGNNTGGNATGGNGGNATGGNGGNANGGAGGNNTGGNATGGSGGSGGAGTGGGPACTAMGDCETCAAAECLSDWNGCCGAAGCIDLSRCAVEHCSGNPSDVTCIQANCSTELAAAGGLGGTGALAALSLGNCVQTALMTSASTECTCCDGQLNGTGGSGGGCNP